MFRNGPRCNDLFHDCYLSVPEKNTRIVKITCDVLYVGNLLQSVRDCHTRSSDLPVLESVRVVIVHHRRRLCCLPLLRVLSLTFQSTILLVLVDRKPFFHLVRGRNLRHRYKGRLVSDMMRWSMVSCCLPGVFKLNKCKARWISRHPNASQRAVISESVLDFLLARTRA